MRVLTGLLLAGAALVAVPSTAHAEGETLCDFTLPADYAEVMRVSAYQARLAPFLSRVTTATTPGSGVAPVTSGGEADEAARSVLGDQFVMLWADTPRQGWSVAFSPGTHDAASARAAIESVLAARVSAADKDYLMGALTLLPTPYSKAELDAVVSALGPVVADQNGILSGANISCAGTDVHVAVTVIPQETPEVRAQVDALVAPYGGKVRLGFGVPRAVVQTLVGHVPEPLANPGPAKPAPRLRDHVSLPATARCVRGGTLTIKPGKDVQRLRLAAGARKAFASNGTAARLKLKAKRTKVTVTATLKDGRTATQTVTYRRCA